MDKSVINTSFGMFQVIKNNNSDCGVNIKTLDNIELVVLPFVYWWDKDKITDEIEIRKDEIIEIMNKNT